MFGDDAPILPDDDTIGIGVDLDQMANGAGAHRVFVVVEADQARLRHRSRQRVESVEASAIGNEPGALLLEDLPDGSVGALRMGVRPGVGDAFMDQPRIQFVERS
jgi:hypothetical protein